MAEASAWLEREEQRNVLTLRACGVWTVRHVADLDALLKKIDVRSRKSLNVDLSVMEELDTAGAWLIHRLVGDLTAQGVTANIVGMSAVHEPLLRLVESVDGSRVLPDSGPKNSVLVLLERIGRTTYDVGNEAKALINFFGLTVVTFFACLRNPRRLRIVSLVNQIEQTGLNAVPIVCLLSFLIGVVLAFQGADQLRRFGAEIFTVNLLALSVLREIGVLMTAIMLAGRSGSAFTAQIGTMQVNEEVDALRTLGLDPIEVLVLPRINALVISLPILTFLADVMGILGGALMAVAVLDLTFGQFLRQLEEAITVTHFLVGMVKAPVFAFIIAIVGCYEGLRVSGSAESVGRMTTKSVVESIFLVIIADALFSILFSALEI
ncbi:MAG: ABC transporter permease [Proteobacteria bacterium]|nr:ABC transporter permease [Pseudomonadota bacterium]